MHTLPIDALRRGRCRYLTNHRTMPRASKQRHFVIQDRSPVAHIIGKAAILINPCVTQAQPQTINNSVRRADVAVPVKVIAARFDSQPGVAPERRQGFEPPFESGKQGQFERRYIETLSDQALCILHSVHDRLFLADVVRAGGETLW